MPLSSNEAAQALRDIARTERRSANAYGYRATAPHLILWGVIWLAGYGTGYVKPEWANVWLPLVIAGSIASFWIGWRMRPVTMSRYDWRYIATFVAILLFVFSFLSIIPPHTDNQAAAFFPLLVSLFYGLVGIWTRGMRMLLLGTAVLGLTVFGFFMLPAQFVLWMAVVGGGSLILGGVWLRSV
jgi:hypothetical protein